MILTVCFSNKEVGKIPPDKHLYQFFQRLVACLHFLNIYTQGFLRRFRDPIWVPRISNRVPRIRESYHRVSKIRENRVPRIREIGSLQIQTGFLTFSLKNLLYLLRTNVRLKAMLQSLLTAPYTILCNLCISYFSIIFIRISTTKLYKLSSLLTKIIPASMTGKHARMDF